MVQASKAPTLKTVADQVGLSTAAISLILNGKGTFRPETRSRVLATAQDLGYRPNGFAQAVANGRFGTLALLLESQERHGHISTALLDGIEDALEIGDEHLAVTRLPDTQLTDAGFVPKILSRVMADGLLINYHIGIPDRMHELIRAAAVPAIWMNRKLVTDAVHPDDAGDAQMATRHLLSFGHRRIAWLDFNVGPDEDADHYSHADRRAGYRAAMRRAGLVPRDLGSSGGHTLYADRVGIARAFLRDPATRPTAIVAYGEGGTVPTLIAAMAEGLRVPHDLSLVTFGEGSLNGTGQELTVLSTGFRALGHEAVSMLRARLVTRASVPTRAVPGTISKPTGSVAPPPAGG